MAVKVRRKRPRRSEKVDKWLAQRAEKVQARLKRRRAKRESPPSPASLVDVWPIGNGGHDGC